MFTEIFQQKDYYKIDKKKDFTKGRVVWAIIFYTPAKDELKRILFNDEGKTAGHGKVDNTAFTEKSHGPIINEFRLETNEEILYVKAKKRPAVLLQTAEEGDLWKLIKPSRLLDAHLKLSKIWLVLPLYTYKGQSDFKILVEHLYLPPFFPFVSYSVCPEEDSFGRFDRVQMTHMSLIEPTEVIMTNEVYEVIVENFVSYCTNSEYGKQYPYFRESLLEELRKIDIIRS